MIVIHVLKTLAALVLGSIFCYLILLISRIPLCYDIEKNTGRHVFKNKKKKNKEYPNRIRWFFLWDYRFHIKKVLYVLFLLDVLFSVAVTMIIIIIVAVDGNPVLKDIGILVFLSLMVINLIIGFFPPHNYRTRTKKWIY